MARGKKKAGSGPERWEQANNRRPSFEATGHTGSALCGLDIRGVRSALAVALDWGCVSYGLLACGACFLALSLCCDTLLPPDIPGHILVVCVRFHESPRKYCLERGRKTTEVRIITYFTCIPQTARKTKKKKTKKPKSEKREWRLFYGIWVDFRVGRK